MITIPYLDRASGQIMFKFLREPAAPPLAPEKLTFILTGSGSEGPRPTIEVPLAERG
jgi:hypothetical protein